MVAWGYSHFCKEWKETGLHMTLHGLVHTCEQHMHIYAIRHNVNWQMVVIIGYYIHWILTLIPYTGQCVQIPGLTMCSNYSLWSLLVTLMLLLDATGKWSSSDGNHGYQPPLLTYYPILHHVCTVCLLFIALPDYHWCNVIINIDWPMCIN